MTGCDICFIHKTGAVDTLQTMVEALRARDAGEKGYLWFNYYAPTEENLMVLSEPFGIHPLSLEDCLDEEQVPKIEEYKTYVQVLFNCFSYLDKTVRIDEVNLFTGADFFVSVTRCGENGPGSAGTYKEVLEREMRNAKNGPAFALHVILDYIVDRKFDTIAAVGDDLIVLEDIVTENHSEFDHTALQKIRRSLMSLRKSLFHEREILVKICRNDIDIIPESAMIHFNDIYDHITKFFELTEMNHDMVNNLIQTNLAVINNDISKAANDTNLSVKRLTVITTVFMPLTLLSGIFGMSEWTMMTGGGENWKTAYPLFFAFLLIVAAVNYVIIKWFDRKK